MTVPVTHSLGAALASIPLAPLQLFGDFLSLAIVFFVLALLAYLIGARGFAGISMEIARIFVLLFLVLAIISLFL